jgi:hypothetical protein
VIGTEAKGEIVTEVGEKRKGVDKKWEEIRELEGNQWTSGRN